MECNTTICMYVRLATVLLLTTRKLKNWDIIWQKHEEKGLCGRISDLPNKLHSGFFDETT